MKKNKPKIKSKISPKPKPSIANKAWTYVSIAGALIAIIYAGLSLQDENGLKIEKPDSSFESPVSETDSLAPKVENQMFNNLKDPSH